MDYVSKRVFDGKKIIPLDQSSQYPKPKGKKKTKTKLPSSSTPPKPAPLPRVKGTLHIKFV